MARGAFSRAEEGTEVAARTTRTIELIQYSVMMCNDVTMAPIVAERGRASLWVERPAVLT